MSGKWADLGPVAETTDIPPRPAKRAGNYERSCSCTVVVTFASRAAPVVCDVGRSRENYAPLLQQTQMLPTGQVTTTRAVSFGCCLGVCSEVNMSSPSRGGCPRKDTFNSTFRSKTQTGDARSAPTPCKPLSFGHVRCDGVLTKYCAHRCRRRKNREAAYYYGNTSTCRDVTGGDTRLFA